MKENGTKSAYIIMNVHSATSSMPFVAMLTSHKRSHPHNRTSSGPASDWLTFYTRQSYEDNNVIYTAIRLLSSSTKVAGE